MTDFKWYYGVATISRLLKIIRLFGKRALLKRLYSAIETYISKEPTNRSHPMIWNRTLHLQKPIASQKARSCKQCACRTNTILSPHLSHTLMSFYVPHALMCFMCLMYYILQKRPIFLRSLLIVATPWSEIAPSTFKNQ